MLYVLIFTNIYFIILLIIRHNKRKQDVKVLQSINDTLNESNKNHHDEMLRLYELKSKDASYLWYLRNLLNVNAIDHKSYKEFDPDTWHKGIRGKGTR